MNKNEEENVNSPWNVSGHELGLIMTKEIKNRLGFAINITLYRNKSRGIGLY